MIPDSEVGLRDRGLVTIGGALGLLERGLCSGAANHSDANNRKSDGGCGPNEQLRDAAWHDSLHPCQLHRGQSTSRKIPTPVTDVTGSDEISGACFARDFGGWDMQVPTATKIAGPRGKPVPWGHILPPWADSFRFGRAKIRRAASRGRPGLPDLQRVDMTTAHTRGRHARRGAVDLSGSYRSGTRRCSSDASRHSSHPLRRDHAETRRRPGPASKCSKMLRRGFLKG
jgi:hypothetical protein